MGQNTNEQIRTEHHIYNLTDTTDEYRSWWEQHIHRMDPHRPQIITENYKLRGNEMLDGQKKVVLSKSKQAICLKSKMKRRGRNILTFFNNTSTEISHLFNVLSGSTNT